MKKVYICSPYRARSCAQMDRNIEYAQQITRMAIQVGLAPITPHLDMTQCLDERKMEERVAGMAAGLELMKSCDLVVVGTRYGISEGMDAEIAAAKAEGIEVVSAEQLQGRLEYTCGQGIGAYARDHACTSYDRTDPAYGLYGRREPYNKAHRYAEGYL